MRMRTVRREWIDSKSFKGTRAVSSVRGAAVSTFDAAGMEERMDAIRLKQILGAPLTERELMCLQIEQNGMACHARPLRNIPPDSYPSQEDP
jgi:hypothetical protein